MKIEMIDLGDGKYRVAIDGVEQRTGTHSPRDYDYHSASMIARGAITAWWKEQETKGKARAPEQPSSGEK